MPRISFYEDGFNLYHSLKGAERLNNICVKWLNVRDLLEKRLPLIKSNLTSSNLQIGDIYYFSAYANHVITPSNNPVARHRDYIKCLKSTGVRVVMGRFKRKNVHCSICNQNTRRYEEKETDVAIACQVLKGLYENNTDIVVLITGDTDLAAPARMIIESLPSKQVILGFPYDRANRELERLCPGSFKLSAKMYRKSQFGGKVPLNDGSEISRPAEWI